MQYAWVSEYDFCCCDFFRDEESVGIQSCLDKVFIFLLNICAVEFVEEDVNFYDL